MSPSNGLTYSGCCDDTRRIHVAPVTGPRLAMPHGYGWVVPGKSFIQSVYFSCIYIIEARVFGHALQGQKMLRVDSCRNI